MNTCVCMCITNQIKHIKQTWAIYNPHIHACVYHVCIECVYVEYVYVECVYVECVYMECVYVEYVYVVYVYTYKLCLYLCDGCMCHEYTHVPANTAVIKILYLWLYIQQVSVPVCM